MTARSPATRSSALSRACRPGSRSTNRGCRATPERPTGLADNLSQWGIVAGPPRPTADIDFGALEVTLSCDGVAVETVAARGHIDDHFASLAALATQLGRFGLALEPGQHVITGAFARRPVAAPSHWRGDFGATLGTVEVTFT